MSKTRNNHYVPEWYQEEFFEIGCNTLAYLDMKPPQRVLDDGRAITERALFPAPKSRAFKQRDLYSTFFGTSVNDEIERRLFGALSLRCLSAWWRAERRSPHPATDADTTGLRFSARHPPSGLLFDRARAIFAARR